MNSDLSVFGMLDYEKGISRESGSNFSFYTYIPRHGVMNLDRYWDLRSAELSKGNKRQNASYQLKLVKGFFTHLHSAQSVSKREAEVQCPPPIQPFLSQVPIQAPESSNPQEATRYTT